MAQRQVHERRMPNRDERAAGRAAQRRPQHRKPVEEQGRARTQPRSVNPDRPQVPHRRVIARNRHGRLRVQRSDHRIGHRVGAAHELMLVIVDASVGQAEQHQRRAQRGQCVGVDAELPVLVEIAAADDDAVPVLVHLVHGPGRQPAERAVAGVFRRYLRDVDERPERLAQQVAEPEKNHFIPEIEPFGSDTRTA